MISPSQLRRPTTRHVDAADYANVVLVLDHRRRLDFPLPTSRPAAARPRPVAAGQAVPAQSRTVNSVPRESGRPELSTDCERWSAATWCGRGNV